MVNGQQGRLNRGVLGIFFFFFFFFWGGGGGERDAGEATTGSRYKYEYTWVYVNIHLDIYSCHTIK